MSFALVARGVIDHLDGDLDEAKRKYQEALQVGSDLGDKNSIATALVNLGEIEEADGNIDAAYSHYRNSLRTYGELGLQLAIAYCMEVLAGFDIRHMDRPEQAALLFGAAGALREQIAAPIEEYNAGRLAADLQSTRDALGDDSFAAGFEAGRQLSVCHGASGRADLQLERRPKHRYRAFCQAVSQMIDQWYLCLLEGRHVQDGRCKLDSAPHTMCAGKGSQGVC